MQEVAFRHAGRNRPYRLHVPSARGPVPLLVELHGRGIDVEGFDRLTGFAALADEKRFAVALPRGVDKRWNDGRDPSNETDDVGYILAAIDDASERAPIDPARVYLVGMSNGATMAARIACERADRIAAIGQVAGTASADVAARCRPSEPVPIVQIHGTADRFAPYAGGVRHGFRARLFMRRTFGPMVGVDEWARFWVAANGSAVECETRSLPPDTEVRDWGSIVFYRIEDGGHTWPGGGLPMPAFLLGRTSRTFDAGRVVWDFVSRYAR